MHVAHMPTNIHTWYLLRMTFDLNQTTPKFLFSFSIYLPIKKKKWQRGTWETQFSSFSCRWGAETQRSWHLPHSTQCTAVCGQGLCLPPLFPTFLQVAFVWWKVKEKAQQWTKADLHLLTSRDRADWQPRWAGPQHCAPARSHQTAAYRPAKEESMPVSLCSRDNSKYFPSEDRTAG